MLRSIVQLGDFGVLYAVLGEMIESLKHKWCRLVGLSGSPSKNDVQKKEDARRCKIHGRRSYGPGVF